MNEKHTPTSPSRTQVKNRAKTIYIEEKLDVISHHEKGEQIFYTHGNVIFTHTSIHTIRDNTDRITESAQSRTKVFV